MSRVMKDSGIEWVGAIPAHWDCHPVYVYFDERKSSNYKMQEQNLLSLSYGKIIRKDINTNGGLLPASFTTYNIVEDGDIIIRPTDLQNDKRSLRTGLVTERGIITSAYIDLKPKFKHSSRYYHYMLHSADECKVFYNMGNGVRQGLNYSDFSKLMIPSAPIEEQQAIANYLDTQTAKIDAAINEAKELIEKYKAYKQSVITEAVTKGLNPDVQMKDSGIDWIGEIPEHWEATKLKQHIKIQCGYPFNSDLFSSEKGFPLIRIRDITSGKAGTFFDGKYDKNYIVTKNDLLVGMDGDFTVRWWESEDALLNQRCCRIFVSNMLNKRYLYHFLPLNLKLINDLTPSTTVKHLSDKDIKNITIPVPPLAEQRDIVEYLNPKSSQIDAIISQKEQLITQLQEYKKSIIFEYVTGKKEVPNG